MKTIIANDFHGQFRDRKTCDLLFGFIKREDPDSIILNGDIVDFWEISKFKKNPAKKRELNLKREIKDVFENILCPVRDSAIDANIYYTEGNHETRLQTYLWSESPALADLDELQLENLLKFSDVDIEYIKGTELEEDQEGGIWVGDIFVYHGTLVRQKSGYTAHAELDKNDCSGISGHTHRDGKATKRGRQGQKCWWENFCMCGLKPSYVKGIANWNQGWSIITEKDGKPDVEQIAVIDHRYIYRGKVYK
jgi:predicted phosphodiesterase